MKTRIIILNNTYHFVSVNKILNLNEVNKDTLIYFDSEISNINESKNNIKIPIEFNLNSFNSLHNKFNTIKLILNYLNSVDLNLSDDLEMYLGTDKQLFNQLLISFLSPKKIFIIDEGIGMYRKRFFYSYVKNFIYKSLSKLIFKNTIYYIQPLGSHPKVTDVFIRRFDLLEYKRTDVNYHIIKSDVNLKYYNNHKVIVLLPYDEKTNYDKKDFIHFLKLSLLFFDKKKIDLKPHPRDQTNYNEIFYSDSRIEVLPKEILSENLELENYDHVINYRSSSILNLVFNKIKIEKIITISLDKKHLKDKIYPNMVYFKNIPKIKRLIEGRND